MSLSNGKEGLEDSLEGSPDFDFFKGICDTIRSKTRGFKGSLFTLLPFIALDGTYTYNAVFPKNREIVRMNYDPTTGVFNIQALGEDYVERMETMETTEPELAVEQFISYASKLSSS